MADTVHMVTFSIISMAHQCHQNNLPPPPQIHANTVLNVIWEFQQKLHIAGNTRKFLPSSNYNLFLLEMKPSCEAKHKKWSCLHGHPQLYFHMYKLMLLIKISYLRKKKKSYTQANKKRKKEVRNAFCLIIHMQRYFRYYVIITLFTDYLGEK